MFLNITCQMLVVIIARNYLYLRKNNASYIVWKGQTA